MRCDAPYPSASTVPGPELCESRSRTVISRLANGSYLWNVGRYVATGTLRFSLPSSTAMPAATAVNRLVLEPIANRLWGVTGSGFPTARTP